MLGGFRHYQREGVDLETLESAIRFLWANISSGATPQDRIDDCERLLLTDSEAWEWHRPWAQGAVIAVVAALRTLIEADPATAAEPATYAVDVLDLKIIYDLNLDMHIAGSEQVVNNHPFMAREVNRQIRDLDDMANALASNEAEWLQVLRDRAEREAADFFPE